MTATHSIPEIHGYGLFSARPAAGHQGFEYYASDTDHLYRDNGTTWDLLSPGGGGGGAVTSVNGFTGTVILGASDVGAQPLDSDLTAIAALSTTSYGRSLLALANAAALRATAALDTSDSPQFAAINVGHASDTTVDRLSAGDIEVEGNRVFRVGGADVPVADGGTGSSTASGARTNLGLVLGTDVASLTAGIVPIAQLASGTPDGTKFIRDDGTLATPSGGGGGLAQSFVGYNTVGGSWETMTNRRWLCKQITLASAGILLSVDAYIRVSTDQVLGFGGAVFADNSGAPGLVMGGDVRSTYRSTSSSVPSGGGWFSTPIGMYLPAGTYWIAVDTWPNNGGAYDIAYDGSGSDQYFNASIDALTSAYPSAWAITTGSRKYSIRGNLIA